MPVYEYVSQYMTKYDHLQSMYDLCMTMYDFVRLCITIIDYVLCMPMWGSFDDTFKNAFNGF